MQTIAFTNQKGGVGKTTSAVTLAAAAAERGVDVLVVDLDSQGSATELLGPDAPPAAGVADVIGTGPDERGRDVPPARWSDVVLTAREPGDVAPGSGRVDLLPATDMLVASEEHLYSTGDLWAVGAVVSGIRKTGRYGLCVLDCPPAVSRLSVNAVAGADLVVAPATLSSMTIRGIERLHQLVEVVRDDLGEAPRVLYLPCAVDARYSETRRLLSEFEGAFGEYPGGDLLPAVRTSSAAGLAFARRQTAVEYQPDGRLAQDYRAVLGVLAENGAVHLPATAPLA
ncbi:ParA family protein [Rubrivirga sp. S365]|uniref:ParA family protein n=1 Tax=Rubrivirga sp. S365 TaxID=3076080 RepID=UPI0028C9A97C|nr:ParA family protein [Rubrivirga sp. S365]MDT7858211.1 ParA family protein [Rubrivirga sp. S365]